MGKNSKKLRRQEYPDYEEMTEHEKLQRSSRTLSEDQSSSRLAPPVTHSGSAKTRLKEGQLATSGEISGVVYHAVGEIVLLLAGDGIIHELKHYEVYLSQE